MLLANLNRFILLILKIMFFLKKIALITSIITLLLSCNKDPFDKRLQKQWVATHVDNSTGDEIESTIFFAHEGTVTYYRNLKSWSGEWRTDNGVLNVNFENSTINGSYDYKIKSNRANPVGNGLPFDVLTLDPITIDDSLDINKFKGEFNSLY